MGCVNACPSSDRFFPMPNMAAQSDRLAAVSSTARSARILILDTAPLARQAAVSFSTAGLAAELVGGADLVARLKGELPHLVWVHADIGSRGLGQLLALLQSSDHTSALPLVVVSPDARDAPFVAQSRSGIVEILQAPFDPALHTARLQTLLGELSTRTGIVRGRSTGKEFISLFAHLKNTLRSGELAAQIDGEQARVYFMRGELKNASLGDTQGPGVRARMASVTAPTAWTFSEGLGGADGFVDIGAIIEEDEEEQPMTLDEPLLDEPLVAMPPPPPAPAPPPRPSEPQAGPFAVALQTPASVVAPIDPAAAETPVLVVDDDEALAHMLQSYFSKKGYPVQVARDGVAALALLASTHFEVVIADLNMPNLDGWGLLKAVRNDYKTHETLVALFSCHDDYRESLRAMHAGAQAYYSKALKLNALEAQVRELCEPRRRFRRTLAAQQSLAFPLSSLGAQWLLRAVSATPLSAQLDAFDGWSTWRLHFVNGQLHHVSASTEAEAIEGERALMAFLLSRTLEGSFAFGTPWVDSSFGGASTEEVLTQVVATMNEEQQRENDAMLREAQKLEVNADLYRLYVNVGPPAWQAIAKALCEDRLFPRDVMAQLEVTPQEMGAVLKDLIRRRVITLKR